MAKEKKPYRRLPGTGYRRTVPTWIVLLLFFVIGIFALLFRGRRVQLWQGEEHLLLVEWDGYREFYKRFSYRDIQAIIVRKTPEGKIVNIILGLIAGFFGGIAFTIDDVGGRIALLSIAGLFGLILLINFLSGPTCQCQIRTAVQLDELPTLTRLPRARKVINRIRPRIVEAQGQVVPEEIPQLIREMVQPATSQPALAGMSPGYIADDPNLPPRMA
jgi:hypothetical protein